MQRRSRKVNHQRSATCSLLLVLVLGQQAAASDVCASLQVFYNKPNSGDLVVCENEMTGEATYVGTTENQPSLNINSSEADWSTGRLVVGDFAQVHFLTREVDARHRNYELVVQKTGLSDLTNLVATIHGRDGYARTLPPQEISLDPLSGGLQTVTVRIMAPEPPEDGSSSLDPAVLQRFASNDLVSAVEDLEARIDDLTTERPELVKDTAQVLALKSAVELATLSARAVAFAGGPLGVFFVTAYSTLFDFADLLAILFFQDTLVDNVEQAFDRLETTYAEAEELAAKTLFPERIVVSGISNDSDPTLVMLGGPGHRYRNDFQIVEEPAPDAVCRTTGQSQFFDESASFLTVGPISTQNSYDADLNILYSRSTIPFPFGITLERTATPIPPLACDASGKVTADSLFTFFVPQVSDMNTPAGAFSEGLNRLTTSGDVSLASEDGRTVVEITEASPSSVAAAASIPGGLSLLVIDFRWAGDFTEAESATFSVEFIQNGVTTEIFQSAASDPVLHSPSLLREIIQIPTQLQGQTGILRFLLSPSESDGITSKVVLGGFDVVLHPLVAYAGPNQVVQATGPAGAEVTLDGSGSVNPTGGELTYVWMGPFGVLNGKIVTPTLALGEHEIILTIDDGQGDTDSDAMTVEVIPSNLPPVADGGADQSVECADPGGTAVVLDGSASTDPDGDPLTFEWRDANGNVVGTLAIVDITVPLGAHTFTLTVTDDKGTSDSDSVTVTVRDTEAPTLTVSLSPNRLWPPNHKPVEIMASVEVSDTCDPNATVTLSSVLSNEPDSGLDDEDVPNDIQDADLGTDDRTFSLRAERWDGGAGRMYSVTYRAADSSGNHSDAAAQVLVPHDEGQ